MSGDVVFRAEKALKKIETPGVWRAIRDGDVDDPLNVVGEKPLGDGNRFMTLPALADNWYNDGDAEFVAAARQLVPELVTEVKRLREALSEAWDDGNGTGLDGWVGPGRGTLPIDEQAVYNRTRCLDKLTYPAVWS